ncbi:RHS repeat-associated core domain-containing protein, partial [Bacteroides faecis]
KYNGKELDRKNGIDWYDYGARHYDPILGKWYAVDRASEKYYRVSPYTYCINNPILLIDPNGMWPTLGGIKSGINNAVGGALSLVNGAVRAVADNILLGSTSFRETGIYSNATAYNLGQDLGDVVSVFIGGSEILTGLEEMAGGVIATPETAGVSLTVSAKGVADVTHGSLMATSGAMKLFSRKGRVKESGNLGSGSSSESRDFKVPKHGSGKEKANNPPDWAKGEKPYKGEDEKSFAKRLMEKKYGKDHKYRTGPDSEFNKIKKYGDRSFE